CILFLFFLFFFSSRRRHTRFSRDWSSDVCSSDLPAFKRSLRQFIGRPGIEETSRPGFTRSFPFFFEGTFLRSLQHFTFIITIACQDTQAGQGVKVQGDFHHLAFHFARLEGTICVCR